MQPGVISKTASPPTGPAAHGAEPAPSEPTAASRALVAVTPVAAAPKPLDTRHQTAFLAQLLAIKDQHPQTRERRRAEPCEALAAYHATAVIVGG